MGLRFPPFPISIPNTTHTRGTSTTITTTKNKKKTKKKTIRTPVVSASKSNPPQSQQQQTNLSVLRFTLGIPGLDEAYLPRWIGYGFGSLLVLNHFVASDSAGITPAQLRTEALGLALAAFSVFVPYLGKFLPGSTLVNQLTLPEGTKQIFFISPNTSDAVKEDLAWATFVLLRNTNTTAVLILTRDDLCVRGYWTVPDDVSNTHLVDWFKRQIWKIDLSELKETLYFPQSSGEFQDLLPCGTRSFFIKPLLHVSKDTNDEIGEIQGVLILASSMNFAYTDKDRAWIGAVAKKFVDIWKCNLAYMRQKASPGTEPSHGLSNAELGHTCTPSLVLMFAILFSCNHLILSE